MQETFLFNFVLREHFNYKNVPEYILLGILAGFISLYYARTFSRSQAKLYNWKINPYAKALVAGVILMGFYFIFPTLFGEGYESVKLLANGVQEISPAIHTCFPQWMKDWSIVLFTGLIIFLKPIAAAVTIGGGGNGGNFAPSLFTGSYLGFFFSKLINNTGWLKIPEGNFSLAGMAGVLSGVMYCPLSAIFLIAEITNGYELFIPLMLVSSISFFIVKSYEPYSMETKKLALEGQIFTHKKEQNILTTIQLDEMLQDKYDTIGMDGKLRDLVELIKKSEKNIFCCS